MRINNNIRPEVGMGATVVLWGDRLACTIRTVSRNGFKITMTKDFAIRTDDLTSWQNQTYEYNDHPLGEKFIATRRQDGTYRLTNSNDMVFINIRDEFIENVF